MLKIRLLRMGKNKKPFYRIVVMESSKPRNSKYLYNLGTYNPTLKVQNRLEKIKINTDLYKQQLQYGAQPTKIVETLFNLVTKNA